jgi:hypothetical protein
MYCRRGTTVLRSIWGDATDDNMYDKATKQRSRPVIGGNPPVGIRMSDDMLGRLEEWRAQQRPIPSVAEAIRRLLDRALPRTEGVKQ